VRTWCPTRADPVGPEYFCFAYKLWSRPDEDLVSLATQELGAIGLADPARLVRGYVVRVPKAYPIYDADYQGRVAAIRAWLESIENLQQVGRNGLHRYNTQTIRCSPPSGRWRTYTAPPTICGPSTPTPGITRPKWARIIPTGGSPRRWRSRRRR
jgi:hypothetical protein